MIVKQLHENWIMRQVGTEEYLSATVPGSVYNDLLAHGRMEDPFYRDNECRALPLMDYDYEYTTCFDVAQEMLEQDTVVLRMEGVDTVADIFLNGTRIAHVENMHRTWEFSVKPLLKTAGNELRVYLYSPTKFIKEADEKEYIPGARQAMRGFPYLRKAHYMFGWDWGPRLPDAGIWRDVKLVAFSEARIDSVLIRQDHSDARVQVNVEVALELAGDCSRDDLTCEVKLTDPDGNRQVCTLKQGKGSIFVADPKLWWPSGYGAQPLYTVEVCLKKTGVLLDTWARKIGLRTLTMSTAPDQYGEEFCHVVNGVKIFAMGSDYIPMDNILARMNPEKTRTLLQHAKDANMNCIRVWGGGFYPDDYFWDICDELGLLVWMDFMFACAVYRLTEEFDENITAEFIDNLKRIRHHACLGLLCGNNEMEWYVKKGGFWVSHPRQMSDYIKMYEYILPKVCRQYAPDTFYWPSSPSSGGAFDMPQDENRGDVHYWDVFFLDKPFTEYRKFYFRYLSEFGFQSFPCYKTCESFTEEGDRNIFSYVMEKHQRSDAGNGIIMTYMEQTFLYPTSFPVLLYASQLLQAESIRYGVEHYRRHRGRCMGTVIWQLNDCWPVASWSSIDYFGRWKALHYYTKRFYAPILLSCEEEGLLSQDPDPNAQPYEVKKSIRLNVSNETMEDVQVLVRWALRDADARILRQGEETLSVSALSAVWLDKVTLNEADIYSHYVSYECIKDGAVISEGTAMFAQPKHFQFRDPALTVELDGDTVLVNASAFAKSVEIRNDNEDLILDDNYFDMNAGQRRIRIKQGDPTGLKVRSVFDIR